MDDNIVFKYSLHRIFELFFFLFFWLKSAEHILVWNPEAEVTAHLLFCEKKTNFLTFCGGVLSKHHHCGFGAVIFQVAIWEIIHIVTFSFLPFFLYNVSAKNAMWGLYFFWMVWTFELLLNESELEPEADKGIWAQRETISGDVISSTCGVRFNQRAQRGRENDTETKYLKLPLGFFSTAELHSPPVHLTVPLGFVTCRCAPQVEFYAGWNKTVSVVAGHTVLLRQLL